mgnify:CR=1 FL=1
MYCFRNHKVIKKEGENILILYLDENLSEFAEEFHRKQGDNKPKLQEGIKKYILKRLPNIKFKTINVMLGPLLMASIPFGDLDAEASGEIKKAQVEEYNYYTVESGDNLYKISIKFGVNIDEIKDINNLDNDTIYPEQRLKIPKNNHRIYIVRSGDTLYEIGKKYNVSTEELRLHNRMVNNMIYPGDTIYIPDSDILKITYNLPYDIINIGDSGEYVKKIQTALNKLGYSLEEDGIYGSITKGIIKDFQSQYHRLDNDGVYGPKTKEYLRKAILTDHMVVHNPSDVLVLVNKDYSLPANYEPDNLVIPDIAFTFEEYHQKKLMRYDGAKAIEELFKNAKEEGILLYGVSAYRSYDRQRDIFSSKAMNKGIHQANRFSAKAGESEHQTGLAIDVTNSSVNYGLSQRFGATKGGRWLKKNAHKFGFIIRYPKGKEKITGYQYEPWHIRYVGIGVADEIYNNNITLEEYLNKD